MPRKEITFFFAIVFLGVLDWLTTVSGVLFFGASEVNPLLTGLTQTNLLLFSIAKLFAVLLAGFAFYKAGALIRISKADWHFTNMFLNGSCSMTVLALTAIVTSNMVAILKV